MGIFGSSPFSENYLVKYTVCYICYQSIKGLWKKIGHPGQSIDFGPEAPAFIPVIISQCLVICCADAS